MKHRRTILLWTAAIAAGTLSGTLAHADWEAVAHGVAEFDSECGGDDEQQFVDFAAEFYYHAQDDEDWDYDRVKGYSNDEVDAIDWVDDSRQTWGMDHDDPWGSDWADALFLGTHGGYTSNSSYFRMGDASSGACNVYTRYDMLFGNGGTGNEANALVIASCNSMRLSVYQAGGYAPMDGPAGVDSDFNIVNGFHGLSWYNGTSLGHFEDYLDVVKDNGIGQQWIYKMHYCDHNCGGDPGEQWWDCPASMVWGETSQKKSDYYKFAGFRDFDDVGDHDTSTYFFYCGCDPGPNQPALPSC